MDDLHTEFERLVLSSGFTPKESKDFLGLIRLGCSNREIADAAMEIADVVLRGLEPHPILKLVIEEAEETVTKVQVSKDSRWWEKRLRKLKSKKRPACGFWLSEEAIGGYDPA